MKITVIGSGSTGNCYYVETSNGAFILDAGIKLTNLVGVVDFNKVDFCFISHQHKDHSQFANKIKMFGIEVIDTYSDEMIVNNFVGAKSNNRYRIYRFPIQHGEEPNNGIIVEDLDAKEKLIYLTDFNMCKYDFRQIAIDHVMIECNYLESKVLDTTDFVELRRINTHMGLEGCISYLEKAFNKEAIKDIYLCHMSQKNGNSGWMGIVARDKFNKPTYVCRQNGGVDYYE